MLVTGIADLSAQCGMFTTSLPDVELTAIGDDCSASYTVDPSPTTGPATCSTFATMVNGVALATRVQQGNPLTLNVGVNLVTLIADEDAIAGNGEDITQTTIVQVTVLPADTGIACNDGIQVSMGEGCQAIVTPDMVLEGSYCFMAYTVAVEDEDGVVTMHDASVGGAIITAPGEYVVTVSDPSGNSCWSTITAEDKVLPPVTCCGPIEVPCYQTDYRPGATTSTTTIPGSIVAPEGVAPGVSDTLSITFASASDDNTVLDLDLAIDIATNNVAGIVIEIMSPDSLYQTVADFTGLDCSQGNLDIMLDDSAIFAIDFDDCGDCPTAAYCGDYQSMGFTLPALNGEAITGEWNIIVTNNNSTEDLTINSASLFIEDEVDDICFPMIEKYTANGTLITPIWTLIDEQEYQVTFPGNDCSDVFAIYADTPTGEDCTGTYLSGFEREWTFAVDSDFVTGTTCTQQFYDLQLGLNAVVYPPDFDGVDEPIISCIDYQANPGIIDPFTGIVGYPTHIDDESLCSNFNVTYEDVTLEICGSAFKLIRKYTVIDWCTGDLAEHNQIIKVEDDFLFAAGPAASTVESNSQHDCTGDIFVDPLGQGPNGYGSQLDVLFTSCSEVSNVFVEFKTFPGAVPPCDSDFNDVTAEGFDFIPATSLGNGEWLVPDVPVGCVWVRYIVEDDCGNVVDAFTEFTVVDVNPPNPVCLEFTVVAFGADGTAKVKAESFDNGSFDNCGTVDFRAREMGSGDWIEKLEFSCDEFTCDESQMVELIIFDQMIMDGTTFEGDLDDLPEDINYSICMAEVGFQDKIKPTILSGPGSAVLACDEIIANEAELLEILNPASFNFDDNCGEVTPTLLTNVNFPLGGNECGGGSVTLTWVAEDECGNVSDDSFSASITFQTASTVSSVEFPFNDDKVKIFSCPEFDENGDPVPPTVEEVQAFAGTGVVIPTVNDLSCNTTAYSFEDQFFFNDTEDGVCLKIVRTFTLIDWCAYNNSGGSSGLFTESQVITYLEVPDPQIFAPSAVDCETDVLYDSSSNECQPFVKILLNADNDCDFLTWDVTVEDCGGDLGIQTFDSADISGFYTHGEIEVTATVSDRCGNSVTGVYTIEIPDCKPPTPYCLGEVITATLPEELTTEIWASDFELGSYDDFAEVNNCPTCPLAGEDPLEYFFLDDSGNFVPVMEFTCDDITNGIEEVISLDVYVVDPNGAPGFDRDFCTVQLVLQDNSNDICPDDLGDDNDNGIVSGRITMHDNRAISSSTVSLSSNQPEYPITDVSDATGSYDFDNLLYGFAYEVNTSKTTEILNGVSTLDILLIQRHLLSLTPFNNPYQYIAADANNSENVTAADMVAIRNVILERTNVYVNGQDSWRFVDASSTFNNPSNPFPYDETIQLVLNNDKVNQNFTAVKIGDVNNDAQAAFDGETQTEVRGVPLNLTIQSDSYEAGQEVRIDITSTNFEDILGMQFTLNNDKTVEFDRFEAGLINLTNDFAGLSHVDEGKVAVSWNTSAPIKADASDVLFTIVYTALESGTTSHILVDNSITTDEAYNNDLDVIGIELTNENGQVSEAGYSLSQNRPNPFANQTTIAFTLPSSQEASLTIFDMSGRTLQTFSGVYAKGANEINVEASDWTKSNGVFYYQLNTEGYTATKKMILTD